MVKFCSKNGDYLCVSVPNFVLLNVSIYIYIYIYRERESERERERVFGMK